MKRFDDKVVVITGASSGIGRALAYEFASLGSRVVIGARQEDKLQEIAEDITAKGGKVVYNVTDVSSEQDCKALIDKAISAYGGVDILICNAGISMRALFDDVDLSVLHKLMDVNFWGCVYCVKYALPYIQKVKGSIAAVSSVAGIQGLPGRTGYSASKFAMTGFLETIRVENLKKGVHVMIACPGFTATNVRFSALTADGTQQGATPRKEEKMMTAEQVSHCIVKGIARRRCLVLMEYEGRLSHFIKKFAPRLLERLNYWLMAKEPDSPLK